MNEGCKYFTKAMADLGHRYHCMGGIITRAFVKKYQEIYPQKVNTCGLVLTVNSPMMGVPSAAAGVAFSPIVVVSGSQFVEELHSWKWPKSLPYYFIFSY